MEDFKWLFYVLGAVAVLVLRMWRKAFQTPTRPQTPRPNLPRANPSPAVPATSYQDILKEMQAAGERARNVALPAPGKAASAEKVDLPVTSLERIPKAAQSLEKIPAERPKAVKKTSAIELARTAKSMAPTAAPAAVNYGRLLQNPQNMRTAFILSEILTRKFDY